MSPPQDHSHIYIDMGAADTILFAQRRNEPPETTRDRESEIALAAYAAACSANYTIYGIPIVHQPLGEQARSTNIVLGEKMFASLLH